MLTRYIKLLEDEIDSLICREVTSRLNAEREKLLLVLMENRELAKRYQQEKRAAQGCET